MSGDTYQVLSMVSLVCALHLLPGRPFAEPGKNKPLPEISVSTLDGDTLMLEEICKEKPSFIFFWASWCKVCSKHMKDVFKLQKDLGQRVRVFGIAWKDKPETIKAYFANRKTVLQSYIDYDGSVFEVFGIEQTPTMMIVSENGNVVFSGFASFRKLRRILKKQIKLTN
ncbi:TlpA family protein disulfide reductase [bacterium]|nr:TlpA family protein disulfide reductase [bacterium]